MEWFGIGQLGSLQLNLGQRVTYPIAVRDNLQVDVDKRSHGLEFRHSEGLMALGEPNQILHCEGVKYLLCSVWFALVNVP